MAEEEETTSKRKVLKKEYGTTATTKPGMKTKVPAKRIPMSKARASTQVPLESEAKEGVAEGKKRKERVKKTTARVIGRSSIMRDSEEEEEEDAAPTPKAQKLMGDAIRAGAVPSKPKTAPKAAAPSPKPKPKRSTRNIPAEEKNKAPVPEAEMEEEDDESHVLRKLKPKIPDHNDAHPVAENMKIRKDSGLRLWRESGPYATGRRTDVDYRFHTKEQRDFYETILLDKKPIVCDMRWVD